jgi:hypothetical protein
VPHAVSGRREVRAVAAVTPAIAAIAAIGAGMPLRSNQEKRVDVHDPAEHNVEIEPSWIAHE